MDCRKTPFRCITVSNRLRPLPDSLPLPITVRIETHMAPFDRNDQKQSLLPNSDAGLIDANVEQRYVKHKRRQLFNTWIAVVTTGVACFFATRAYYMHPSWIERIAAAQPYCMPYDSSLICCIW